MEICVLDILGLKKKRKKISCTAGKHNNFWRRLRIGIRIVRCRLRLKCNVGIEIQSGISILILIKFGKQNQIWWATLIY